MIKNYLPKISIENELIIDNSIVNCSQQLTSIYFPIENRITSFTIIIRGYLTNQIGNVQLFNANGNFCDLNLK